MMKVVLAVVVAIVAITGGAFTAASMKWIDTGNVGVVYSMSDGVQDEVLTQGVHFIGPFWKVKQFTIGNEQLILSKDSRDGSEGDDSFNVATSDDASISISFQMSYRFNPDTVTETYQKFQGMDGEDIIESRVKTVLKSKVSEITTDYSMMDIYSGNRSEINKKITEYLNKELGTQFGIEVMDASIIDVHPDEKLQESINNRVRATQEKQQAELEQEKVRVQAETKLIEAQNEADIKLKQAEAEAQANKMIAQSVTDELIRMKEAEARLEHGWVEVQGAEAVVTK